MEETFLWQAVQHMTIASYLHSGKKGDQQVKNMARRYMLKTEDKLARRTLRNILKTKQPRLLIQIAYADLMKQAA